MNNAKHAAELLNAAMQNIYDAGIYDCVSSETRDELESSMNILRGVSENLSAKAIEMMEATKANQDGEMQFRCKRFALAIEAIYALQNANVWFDDEGYPGWTQIDKALTALREFKDLPEYDEWSGNSASVSMPF
jgi:hypothetical protein